MRDLASLYFLTRHTFVCGTLFRRIRKIEVYPPKQSGTYKSAILADIIREAKSRNFLFHNGTIAILDSIHVIESGTPTGNFLDSGVFLHILFLGGHNFINNHPPDLKLVSNDAPCDLLQSALKIRL